LLRILTDPRLHFPATRNNRDAIFAVLERVLPPTGLVLELNSGSGEHAAYMAPRLAPRRWLPSDTDPTARASIAARVDDAGAPNLLPPCDLDVTSRNWPVAAAAAIVSINLIHIAPWEACLGLLDGAARTLGPGDGVLYLYGPFKRGGAHTAPSNARFDRSLKAQNPLWGVRDIEDVTVAASARGLRHDETIEMPANNLSIVFRKEDN
jgi:hypothetical protein